MSRWLYQMSEATWSSVKYRRSVGEGSIVRWHTGKLMFAYDGPAPGDIIVCFYALSGSSTPGICGLGLITKFLAKTRRFDWLPLPPTNFLKQNPWWDERAKEIAEVVRAQSPRATMYPVPAVLDTDLRRGIFMWARE